MSAGSLVVKIGSSTLTDVTGKVDSDHIDNLAAQIADVYSQGWQVAVVSSGAIACGLEALGTPERPTQIADLQAAASVGQGRLIHRWTEALARHSIAAGQILLTQSDFAHREHYLNARNALRRLIELRVVPIVNENDATAVQEIRMGDNDTLAAMVACTIQADLLILLSDVDGLCDPESETCVPHITEITPEIEAMAGGSAGRFGSGGMATKVGAAKIVTNYGIGMVIADGRMPDVIVQAVRRPAGAGAPGSYFAPLARNITDRKAWIAFGRLPKGDIMVDSGAVKAISVSGSLLAAGVTGAAGRFGVGDTVNVVDENGRVVARGLTNYSAEEVSRIKGRKSSELLETLGEDFIESVIHRDSLVLLG